MLNRQAKIELYYKTIRQKIHPKDFFFPIYCAKFTVVQSLHTPFTPQETSFEEQQGGWKKTNFSKFNGMCLVLNKISINS